MSDEYYQKVTAKEKDFTTLWGRMDEDKKLLTQEEFVWRDKDDRAEPDVDNITLNDAAVFANMVHNTLIKGEITPEVEGDGLKDEEAEIIEDFIRDISIEADASVSHQDIPNYKIWELLQACDRGRIARRITLREENGKLATDSFLAVDTRYLIYEHGLANLNWVATKLPRTQDDVEEEYGYKPASKDVIITDFWDKEVERVYCGTELISEERNYWGEPPFVIQVIPTGIFTFDADRFLYSGESIFSLSRHLFKEKNMFATILKSLTVKSFFNGLQLEVEDVALARKPEIPPHRKRIVAPIKAGTKGYFNMPIQELIATARAYYQILDEAIQKSTLPKVSYGVYPSPASGVGIAELKEAEDPVFYPRLQGYTLFLQRLYKMILSQYIKLKMSIELGDAGVKTQYHWKDLDKPINLRFRVDLSSPKMDMVNISTAAAVGNLVSDDTKRRDYLHLKNPDEENTKMLAEKASRMSPAVAKYDVIKALFDRGEKIKANLMAVEMGLTLDELLSGQVTQQNEIEEEQAPKQLLPMFGASGASPLAGEEKGEI